ELGQDVVQQEDRCLPGLALQVAGLGELERQHYQALLSARPVHANVYPVDREGEVVAMWAGQRHASLDLAGLKLRQACPKAGLQVGLYILAIGDRVARRRLVLDSEALAGAA